jgi:hypothetical protein
MSAKAKETRHIRTQLLGEGRSVFAADRGDW